MLWLLGFRQSFSAIFLVLVCRRLGAKAPAPEKGGADVGASGLAQYEPCDENWFGKI